MRHSLSRSELRAALFDILPALVATAPIGLLFGALAVAKGMTALEAALMSALVFAAGAQFAALELWQHPLPLFGLLVSTALINSRHILMSISIVPKLRDLRPGQRIFGLAFLSDANWALSERRAGCQSLTASYFLGMGAVYWGNWLFWTSVGAWFGPLLGDPKRFGADFAFVAILIGIVVSTTKRISVVWTVVASAIAATLVHAFVGSPWHVIVGALAAGCTATLLHRGEPAE